MTRASGARLISIIGPPAVGKTTLAEALCGDLGAAMIREDWQGNPFLAESYDGDDRWRLPGQLYFLASRVGQQARSTWPAEGIFVSDYGFCQDRIFAAIRLGGDDMQVYERIAASLEPLVHPPDVLIHMDAAERTLLERIARRGRRFERAMDAGFLAAVRAAYNQAATAAEVARCPVLTVDCDRVDLRVAANRRELVERITAAL